MDIEFILTILNDFQSKTSKTVRTSLCSDTNSMIFHQVNNVNTTEIKTHVSHRVL